MIVQRPDARFDAVREPVPGRKRAWGAKLIAGRGGPVIVRHYIADLAPDEDLADWPETHELAWAEWLDKHTGYGLAVDGSPLAKE